MNNVYKNAGRPVLLNADALSPDQLHSLQSNLSGRLREQAGQPSSFSPALGGGARASGGRPGNCAPRAHQAPPGVLDANYYAGCYLDVVA